MHLLVRRLGLAGGDDGGVGVVDERVGDVDEACPEERASSAGVGGAAVCGSDAEVGDGYAADAGPGCDEEQDGGEVVGDGRDVLHELSAVAWCTGGWV